MKEAVLETAQRLARSVILRGMRAARYGTLELIEPDGKQHVFGAGDEAESRARLEVVSDAFWTDLLLGGSLTVAGGGSYIRDHWRTPDLRATLSFFAVNSLGVRGLSNPLLTLPMRVLMWIRHSVLNANTMTGARRNIAAHYDLDSRFFKLFLDKEMMYSSNIYPSPDSDLDAAVRHRLDIICQRLELDADDHLLEIGSGWGGLAIHAAREFGCRVTTVTLSKGQYDYAMQRIRDEGLEDRIELLLRDYRVLEGQYDKLVSVEMIEAVGAEYFGEYFRRCSKLLKPDGLMLIQGIFSPEQTYAARRRGVDFIKQYIFPGGCLPSLGAVSRAIAKGTDLQIVDLDDITPHYARTLADWCERFMERLDEVRALGFDDAFIRSWEFYLRYCEVGFRQRLVSDLQLLFAKPDYRMPQAI